MSRGAFSPKVKMRTVDRQDGACAICMRMVVGTLDYTKLRDCEYHHRSPRRMGGSRDPSTGSAANCLLLCESCHRKVETQRSSARAFGWLVPWGTDPASVRVFHLGEWVRLDVWGGTSPVGSDAA